MSRLGSNKEEDEAGAGRCTTPPSEGGREAQPAPHARTVRMRVHPTACTARTRSNGGFRAEKDNSVPPRGDTLPATFSEQLRADTCRFYHAGSFEGLIREGPSSGPLSLAPVSAKELKERAFQGVL